MTASPVQAVWAKCLDTVAQEVTPQAFKTWFAPLKPVSLDSPDPSSQLELCLELPSQFYHEWLSQHYGPLLDNVVTNTVGQPARITYSVSRQAAREAEEVREMPAHPATLEKPRPQIGDAAQPYREAFLRPMTAPHTNRHPETASSTGIRPSAPMNPNYTFDRFIEGDCNRLARSAALAISERPGATSFNPFVIYGGVGLGKTHLVQAIGNYVVHQASVQRMRYISSEQFTSEFVQAIQTNRIMEFTQFYRQMDLLIVDDIQFFGGKEKTQEEFFHVFNDLHQRGKQVVLCADRPPRDIPGIEERLLSRFQWGLTADVQLPDLETRIAILNHKAEAEAIEVPHDVVEFIAERVTSNVRELEGSLIRLTAHARLQRCDITLDLAQEALSGLLSDEPVRLEIGDIQRVVAEHYDVEIRVLSGKSRKREIVNARHTAMYLSKHHTQHTLKTIGSLFGGRDHSTVIHACSAIEDRLDTDPGYRDELLQVQKKLRVRTR